MASELSFLLEPSDVIAVRERPLMLDCRVQGEEPIMVTWRKNGVPLPTSQRVQVLANGTLVIQSFQKRKEGSDADMGEYDCAAQNRYGMLVSRKAKVLLACKCSTVQHSTLLLHFIYFSCHTIIFALEQYKYCSGMDRDNVTGYLMS